MDVNKSENVQDKCLEAVLRQVNLDDVDDQSDSKDVIIRYAYFCSKIICSIHLIYLFHTEMWI